MLERIVRTTGVACALTAIVYAVVRRDVLSGIAVLGGGVLIGLSYWAIRGTVDGGGGITLGCWTSQGQGFLRVLGPGEVQPLNVVGN